MDSNQTIKKQEEDEKSTTTKSSSGQKYSYHESEREFSVELMSVLTGVKSVPDSSPEIFIKDRSISPMENQRVEAIQYIQKEIQKLDFSAEIQEWDGKCIIKKGVYKGAELTWKYNNIIITIPGTLPLDQQKTIVIGAHHDTQNSWSSCWHGSKNSTFLPTVGADDNTSGVVGCMTLLYRLKKNSIKLKNTLKIVLFDGEEPGIANFMCSGSGWFVRQLSEEDKRNISLALIIDMIGGPPTVPEIGLVISVGDTVPLENLVESISEIPGEIPVTLAHHSFNYDLSCLRLSDSVRFDDEAIPTLLLCNVAGYTTTPSFYHTENDTMEILDWSTFFRAVDVAEGLILKADEKPE